MNNKTTHKGAVLQYVPERGYGFLSVEGVQGDVFFRARQLPKNAPEPEIGMELEVTLEPSDREQGKMQVANIHKTRSGGAFDFFDAQERVDGKKLVKEALYHAERLGKDLTRNKLRQYFDAFMLLTHSKESWDTKVLGLNMQVARAQYDANRKSPAVSPQFVTFLRRVVDTVLDEHLNNEQQQQRLSHMGQFFEAVVGFGYAYTKNK